MKPGRTINEIDKMVLGRQRHARKRHIVQRDKMSHDVGPAISAKITVTKDGQHCIGLSIRVGVGEAEIACIGGAADAHPCPEGVIIAVLRLQMWIP